MVGVLKNNKGFSLIEVILASVIISLGLLGGVFTLQNSLISSVNRDLNTVAAQLANEKVAMILADNYFKGYEYTVNDVNYPNEQFDGSFSGFTFTRKVSIEEVDPDDLETPLAGSGINKIDVTVNWGAEDFQTVKLSTLIAEVK